LFELFCEGESWGTSMNEEAAMRGFMFHSLYNPHEHFALHKDGELFTETKKEPSDGDS
jgi:inosine/xanthosine triphosphate pyrophosphatase family protein